MDIDLELLRRLAFDALPVLLDAAVKGLVLLAVAGVLVLAMRKASAAARQVVWLLALGALIVLPIASAALPSWGILPGWVKIEIAEPAEPVATDSADSATARTLIPPADPLGGVDRSDMHAVAPPSGEYAPAAAPFGQAAAIEPAPQAGSDMVASVAATARSATPARTWRSWIIPSAVAVWLVGALVCLLPLVLGRISLWRLARRSRQIASGSWATLSKRAANAIGLRRPVTILQSSDEPMPMVWGALRPKLLLPAEAEEWSADRRWVVLLHELAHAKRRDCLAKLISHIACAFYWFNPLSWIAFKLMQRETEQACDDLVLAAGHRPSDYAQHLLEIASGLKSGMLAAYSSIAMARKSKLEGRLLAILDANRNRRSLTRIGIILAAVVVAAIAMPLACLRATQDDSPAAAQPTTLVAQLARLGITPTSTKRMVFADDEGGFGSKTRVEAAMASEKAVWKAIAIAKPFTRIAASGYRRVEFYTVADAAKPKAILLVNATDACRLLGQDIKESFRCPGLHKQCVSLLREQYQRQHRVPTPPTGKKPSDAPPRLVGRLASGIEVELLGVRQSPSTGKPWWRADGSPLADPPYDHIDTGPAQPTPGQLGRELALFEAWGNVDWENTAVNWVITPHAGWSSTTPRDADGRVMHQVETRNGRAWKVSGYHAFCANLIGETVTIRREYAAATFAERATWSSQAPPAGTKKLPEHFRISPPVQASNSVTITVKNVPIDHNCRLFAVDASGQERRAEDSYQFYPDKRTKTLRFLVRGKKLSEVRKVRLESRPFDQWVEFRNVSLRPGVKTDVQVVTSDMTAAATQPAASTSSGQAGSKLEFRIAPRASSMDKLELEGYMAELKVGKVGFWYMTAKITGRVPDHAWLPISGELTISPQLVTGEYQGKKYVLVSDKPGQTMGSGEGKDAWGLVKVYATKDGMNRPTVGFELDDRGAELFRALTKANIDNPLAIVVDGKVFSAPVIRTAMGKNGMITGSFTEQKVARLVEALRAGMPANPPATQPAVGTDPVEMHYRLGSTFAVDNAGITVIHKAANGNLKTGWTGPPKGQLEFDTFSLRVDQGNRDASGQPLGVITSQKGKAVPVVWLIKGDVADWIRQMARDQKSDPHVGILLPNANFATMETVWRALPAEGRERWILLVRGKISDRDRLKKLTSEPLNAATQPAEASPLAGLKLRLVLADKRKEYRIGETVKFNVLAENTGKQAVKFSLNKYPPTSYSNRIEGGRIRLHDGFSYMGGELFPRTFVIQPGRSELLDTEECLFMPPDWRGNTKGRPGVIGVKPQRYSVSYRLFPRYSGQVRTERLDSAPLVVIDVLPGNSKRIRQLTAKYPSGREVAEKFALEFLSAIRKGDAKTVNRMIMIHPNFGRKKTGDHTSSAADYAERMKQSQQWWQDMARQLRAIYAGPKDLPGRLSETYCLPENSPRPGVVCVRIAGPAGSRDKCLWLELSCWSDGWRVKNAGFADSNTSLKKLLTDLRAATHRANTRRAASHRAAALAVHLGKGPGAVMRLWKTSKGVSVSGDGKQVAVAKASSVYILDLATGKEIKTLDLGNRGGQATLSPDGKLLAINRGNVFDVATGKEVIRLKLDGSTFHHPEFSADGEVLGFNTGTNYYLFDTATWKPIRIIKSPAGEFTQSALSGDGKTVVLDGGQPAPNVHVPASRRLEAAGVWDVATGKRLLAQPSGNSLSHDGRLVACADGNQVEVVDVRSGRTVWKRRFEGQEKATAITAISPAGDMVAVYIEGPGNSVRGINLYATQTGKLVGQLAGADMTLQSLRFSRDGRLLIGYFEVVVGESKIWRIVDATRPAAKLGFRIAPKPSHLNKAELASYMDWLKAGKVGFWWKGGRMASMAGRMPDHAWLTFSGKLTNASQLVTGDYKGQKYVLVSDKPGQIMVRGEGHDAWGLTKVYAAKDGSGRPAIGFELDDRGAKLFAALTKANIGKALAIVIDGRVVSAPKLMAALSSRGMITGQFTEQQINALVKRLKAGMKPAKPPATQPADRPTSELTARLARLGVTREKTRRMVLTDDEGGFGSKTRVEVAPDIRKAVWKAIAAAKPFSRIAASGYRRVEFYTTVDAAKPSAVLLVNSTDACHLQGQEVEDSFGCTGLHELIMPLLREEYERQHPPAASAEEAKRL